MITYMGRDWYDLNELTPLYGRSRSVILRCIKFKLTHLHGTEILSIPYSEAHSDGHLRGGPIKLVSPEAKKELDTFFVRQGRISARDATKYLGCSLSRLTFFAKEGKIPCEKYKDSVDFLETDIEKIKESGLIKGVRTDWKKISKLFEEK